MKYFYFYIFAKILKTKKMKQFPTLILIFFIAINLQAQVGINTENPQAALDIQSVNSGLLIPRVALTAATDVSTVLTPKGDAPVISTMVYNDGTGGLSPAGIYYWNGTVWSQFKIDTDQVFTGKFRISSTGAVTITGIPFEPKTITFEAFANVENYNLNSDNGVGDNNGTFQNSFGYMYGYAKQESGATLQQVINGGGSANSINDTSRYDSSSRCIGIRFSSDDGDSLGLTTATLTGFNSNGFTLNVDNYRDSLVIMFTAYKY